MAEYKLHLTLRADGESIDEIVDMLIVHIESFEQVAKDLNLSLDDLSYRLQDMRHSFRPGR